MTTMAMFPLASVLFPGMPMALRVFEDRYLVMMSRVLQQDTPEFGVVLIERGSEAGGGEQRFGVGTVAHITQMETDGHTLGLVVRGTRRVEVTRWLEDRPHPQAEVRDLPDLQWSDALQPLREEAERRRPPHPCPGERVHRGAMARRGGTVRRPASSRPGNWPASPRSARSIKCNCSTPPRRGSCCRASSTRPPGPPRCSPPSWETTTSSPPSTTSDHPSVSLCDGSR